MSFLNKNFMQCEQCDISCQQCVGPTLTDCITCASGYILSGKFCLKCGGNCLTCSGSVFNCLSCRPGFVLKGNLCVNQACNEYCDQCSDFSFCSKCKTQYYLGTDGTCQKCDASCKECNGSLSNNCTSCFDYNFVSSGVCVRKCEDFQFYNQNSQKCQKCSQNCVTCFGVREDECFTCKSGFIIQKFSCVQDCLGNCDTCKPEDSALCFKCKDGFFKQSTSNSSSNPDFDSSLKLNSTINNTLLGNSSSNLTLLQSVNSTQIYFDYRDCVSQCPIFQFQNSITGTCDKCPEYCSKCRLGGVQNQIIQCLSCKDGSVLSENKCVKNNMIKCHTSCLTCIQKSSSYSDCLTCPKDKKLKLIQNNQGICECPSEKFENKDQVCSQNPGIRKTWSTAEDTASTASATTAMCSIAALNPISALHTLDFEQTLSSTIYLNKKRSLQMDDYNQKLYYSHISTIFGQPNFLKSNSKTEVSSQTRILQQQEQILDQNSSNTTDTAQFTTTQVHNPKIAYNEKNEFSFIAFAFPIYILHFLVYLMGYIVKYNLPLPNQKELTLQSKNQLQNFYFFKEQNVLPQEKQSSIVNSKQNPINEAESKALPKWKQMVRNLLYLSLYILVFTYTLSEHSILIFYQFSLINSSNGAPTTAEAVNIIFSIFGLIYTLAIPGWMFYQFEWAHDFDTFEGQCRFAFFYKYFDTQTRTKRMYIFVFMLRKIISSFFYVFIFGRAYDQAIYLTITYGLYWLYIIIVNPFKEQSIKILMAIVETLIFIIHIILILICDSDDGGQQDIQYSLSLFYLTITIFIIYIIFSVSIIIYEFALYIRRRELFKSTSSMNISEELEVKRAGPLANEQIYPNVLNQTQGKLFMEESRDPVLKNSSEADFEKLNQSQIDDASGIFIKQDLQFNTKNQSRNQYDSPNNKKSSEVSSINSQRTLYDSPKNRQKRAGSNVMKIQKDHSPDTNFEQPTEERQQSNRNYKDQTDQIKPLTIQSPQTTFSIRPVINENNNEEVQFQNDLQIDSTSPPSVPFTDQFSSKQTKFQGFKRDIDDTQGINQSQIFTKQEAQSRGQKNYDQRVIPQINEENYEKLDNESSFNFGIDENQLVSGDQNKLPNRLSNQNDEKSIINVNKKVKPIDLDLDQENYDEFSPEKQRFSKHSQFKFNQNPMYQSIEVQSATKKELSLQEFYCQEYQELLLRLQNLIETENISQTQKSNFLHLEKIMKLKRTVQLLHHFTIESEEVVRNLLKSYKDTMDNYENQQD